MFFATSTPVARLLVAFRCAAPFVGAAMAAMAVTSSPALAGSLLTDGQFTGTSGAATYNNSGTVIGSVVNGTDLSGWSASACVNNCSAGQNPFLFIMLPNYGTSGVWWYPSTNQAAGGTVTFYTTPGASPDGGNDIGEDAGNLAAALQQTITGLTVGDHYQVTFYQASTQAVDGSVTGAFTGNWQVSLGGTTQNSTTMSNAYHSDTPWTLQTLNFTATSTSELLSFLAVSPQTGEPPFLLLGDVSLMDIPEPGSAALLAAGALALALRRSKRAT